MALTAVVLLACVAGATAKIKQTSVYMFGFATSLTDSVVYITDIQRVDSAYIDTKTNFLQERALYSLQLQNYIERTYAKPFATCVVFFAEKKSKLEAEFVRVRKRYKADSELLVQPIGGDAFRFVPETHYE